MQGKSLQHDTYTLVKFEVFSIHSNGHISSDFEILNKKFKTLYNLIITLSYMFNSQLNHTLQTKLY